MSFKISLGTRIRRSPYFDATIEAGVTHFSTYNRMYMPTSYGDPEGEYWRLINAVSMWDVAVERQVELAGPDAARLAQVLTARRVDRMQPGRGRYVATCNHRGVLINDPVLLMLDENRYWFSIADSDLLLWARAIAHERGFDVALSEPDVAPLAIQGPKAEDVVADLLGDAFRELRLFQFREAMLEDIPLLVARSGWSKQDGFELYLRDALRGLKLWHLVREAGQPYDIGPGAPNQSERIEGGLLSWGADTDDETTPFEVRMGRFVDLDLPDDTIGLDALRREQNEGSRRHQLGIRLEGNEPLPGTDRWHPVIAGDRYLGRMTSLAWSPRLGQNIGLCLLTTEVEAGEEAHILDRDNNRVAGQLCELPFI